MIGQTFSLSHSKLGKSDVATSGAKCQQCYSLFLQVCVTTEHLPELLPLSPQRVQIGRLKTLTIIIKSNEQNSFDLFFVLFHFLHVCVCVFVLHKSERYGSGEKIALIAIWPIWYITKSIYRGRTVSRTINQITEGRYHSDTQ